VDIIPALPAILQDILGADGSIARRLGERYEFRPQQLEMATAVEEAFAQGHHLLAEAGTGVGKSFAYLLPAIDYAVKKKKRVVISTHTISLQEQLIDKDIPLLQSVYPDEFTAILVKGRSNYLCKRRLEQTRARQGVLFDHEKALQSLWMVEQWASETTDGSLADLPQLPEPDVWDKVCAEHGNCLGKKCRHYEGCFWQGAKRRMNSGNVLVVNHALFFSDLALRMVGVNYLPKYDVVILDEAHTVEDVAGQHFGIKFSEAGLKYQLRSLYDPRRGKGMLSVHGSVANDAIGDVVDLYGLGDRFFERAIEWHKEFGRGNGRVREKNFIENDLSPKLRDLAKHLKTMLLGITDDEELAEISATAGKVATMADALDAVIQQTMEDAVYWVELAGRTPQRVSLHAAPVNVSAGLRKHLFEKLHSVVMTSATLCTGNTRGRDAHATGMPARSEKTWAVHGTGVSPVKNADAPLKIREGAYLPHWTQHGAIYAVNFRLADSLPSGVVEEWKAEAVSIMNNSRGQGRGLTDVEVVRLRELHTKKLDTLLDQCQGECILRRKDIAEIVAGALRHFDGERYNLLAWCVMPNHVHAVIQPVDGAELPGILHTWKSFTAHAIDEKLGREGIVWQDEYFDHLVRDERDLEHAVEYAWSNAENAGLGAWEMKGRNDEKILKLTQGEDHGRDARATSSRAGLEKLAEEGKEVDPAFAYITSRLGVVRAKMMQFGSPFEYERQATLYIETSLPDPSDALRYTPAACERIVKYLKQTDGGAFVLFTSYKSLLEVANRVTREVEKAGMTVLVQGQGAPRRVLLERFRSTPNSVLFGTSSFWQGIDVQGDALRNVIIVKLPFAVPDEPITEARLDAIKRTGGNPFMEYSVPEAVIKLKQGFGRLIRSKTDTGIVVLLDSRVKTKRYGKIFLDALPACKTVEVK
jgi:Rad3-related DNA helicase/REP element-mobilizing transposase RayT